MTKKILLIEGDASICTPLNQWLTRYDYDVVLATEGGDEGILLAVTAAPDLIIIDTDLSVIDGLQAIKILKASTVTQKIPIIALTAPACERTWNQLLTSGCNACELKPVDQTSILSKVKALTEPIALDDSAPALFPDYEVAQQSTASAAMEPPVKTAVLNSKDPRSTMVVYVDDSPADSRIMAGIVEGLGYGYENIGEPLKALPLLLELRPKLIFLDLVMPFTNGYEMCAQIRRTSAFRKTPIVIVTNNDGIIDRVRARFVGASGFFSKPVREERVVKVLRKYLSSADETALKDARQRILLPFV